MKASKLIQRLEQLVAEHGDLPVKSDGWGGTKDAGEHGIYPYTDCGDNPSTETPATEFYIH